LDKPKIILSVIAGGLVVSLFLLPRIVIKPQEEQQIEPKTAKSDSHLHEMHLTYDDSIKVAQLQKLRRKDASNLEVIDSLAYYYGKNALFDSSITYYSMLANKAASLKNSIKLADAYYAAFSVSEGASKEEYSLKAQSHYKTILDKDSMNLDIRAKYAMTLATGSSPMQAVMALRKNLEKDSKHELTLFNLGLLSMQSGQYQKAVDRFESLLKINSNNPQACYYLGLSYKQLGNKDLAKKMLKQALEISKDPAIQEAVEESLSDM